MNSAIEDRDRQASSTLTVTITDAVRARVAEGVLCLVERQLDGNWQTVALGASDCAGAFSLDEPVIAGMYRITLDTDPYFAASGIIALMPKITVAFRIAGERSELRAFISANSQFSAITKQV
jgi:5-hydroxyisourate hydrolase